MRAAMRGRASLKSLAIASWSSPAITRNRTRLPYSGVPSAATVEADRLSALHSLRILDTPAEERFDRLTRVAAALFDTPISTVTLIDEDRQWHKACLGVSSHEDPR